MYRRGPFPLMRVLGGYRDPGVGPVVPSRGIPGWVPGDVPDGSRCPHAGTGWVPGIQRWVPLGPVGSRCPLAGRGAVPGWGGGVPGVSPLPPAAAPVPDECFMSDLPGRPRGV